MGFHHRTISPATWTYTQSIPNATNGTAIGLPIRWPGVVCGVNVGIYSIHGVYGIVNQ